MASRLQATGKAHIFGLATKVDLVADTIKVLFYSGADVPSAEFVGDLTGGSIVARSGAFAGKTVTDGVFDANDITVSAVSGAAFTRCFVYKDTGSDATSVIVSLHEVATYTPNGSDINVVWNASGLFAI